MKINKTYITEKLIGLGFVLDDKTVEIRSDDLYSHNTKVIAFIIVLYYSVAGYLSQFTNDELTVFIESFFSVLT